MGEEKGEEVEKRERKVVVNDMLQELGPSKTFEKVREVAGEYSYNLRSKGRLSFSDPKEGEVPSIHLVRRTLPEVWEDTTMALLGIGQNVHTGYDPVGDDGEYLSFPSMEGTVTMHIEEPFGEPRLHQHYLAGGMGFGDYLAEVEGVKDHWMITPDVVVGMIKKGKFNEIADDHRWKYTYHQRLYTYPCIDINAEPRTINQIESVINKLVREPLSKSGQAVTWDARWDHNDGQMGVKWADYDSPCLQRFWFRLVPFEKGYKMNVNTHWRSRDHLKAVPQNIFAVTEGICEKVRLELQERLGVPVERGRYVDINDSLHLYGHYYDTRKQGLDAESYLEDVFRISEGQPIEKRLMIPGTNIYEMTMETIKQEYESRIKNPDLGRPEK